MHLLLPPVLAKKLKKAEIVLIQAKRVQMSESLGLILTNADV